MDEDIKLILLVLGTSILVIMAKLYLAISAMVLFVLGLMNYFKAPMQGIIYLTMSFIVIETFPKIRMIRKTIQDKNHSKLRFLHIFLEMVKYLLLLGVIPAYTLRGETLATVFYNAFLTVMAITILLNWAWSFKNKKAKKAHFLSVMDDLRSDDEKRNDLLAEPEYHNIQEMRLSTIELLMMTLDMSPEDAVYICRVPEVDRADYVKFLREYEKISSDSNNWWDQ